MINKKELDLSEAIDILVDLSKRFKGNNQGESGLPYKESKAIDFLISDHKMLRELVGKHLRHAQSGEVQNDPTIGNNTFVYANAYNAGFTDAIKMTMSKCQK